MPLDLLMKNCECLNPQCKGKNGLDIHTLIFFIMTDILWTRYGGRHTMDARMTNVLCIRTIFCISRIITEFKLKLI